jgi:spore maturation protein CgeB
VTFYEPDAFERQKHRDLIAEPDWASSVVYPATASGVEFSLQDARRKADLVVKASGVGVFDDLLEREVLRMRDKAAIVFWDVDAPATLDRMAADPHDPFRSCVPKYDAVLTYGGGDPVVRAYKRFGARECVPIYNALDPQTHHPAPADPRFTGTLGLLANRLPDREARIDEFFFRAAAVAPESSFLLGGNGWQGKSMPANVRYLGHVYTGDHNTFNCTPTCVLNVSRESMARYGFSPATRVFEAAGAGACLITDDWEGIELFLEPGREVLVAADGLEVAAVASRLHPDEARTIGQAALQRVLREHTYAHRSHQVDALFTGRLAAVAR